jgi:hypothetical protein
MEKGMINKSLYIYGFVPNDYDNEQLKQLESIGVSTIPFRKTSAIVSPKSVIDIKQLSTEALAELMIHHQKTIESLMSMGFNTIIPMRLGTFSTNSDELTRIIEKGYDLILEITDKVTNLIEVEIVTTWSNFNQIMTEIAVDPKIVEMKEECEKSETGMTQSDQISIGHLVKNILDELQSKYEKQITQTFSPFCKDIKQHELLSDQIVSNTAFLIPQSKLVLFEKALDELDENLNGKLNFKLVSPLPCYSFYTMDLESLSFENIESAIKELGLNNSTTEKNIQQAYINKAKLFHPDTNSGEDSVIRFDQINKAYQTLLDYVNAVKPSSKEEQFSLQKDAVIENSLFLKIKE